MPFRSDSFAYFFVVSLCFVLGYLWSPQCLTEPGYSQSSQQSNFQESRVTKKEESIAKNLDSIVIQEQTKAAEEFQTYLRTRLESPLDCSRILAFTIPYDGKPLSWIESFEILAKALKVAVSTERRLLMIISNNEDRTFCGFTEHRLYCRLMEVASASRCSPSGNYVHPESSVHGAPASSLQRGIQEHKSDFFNTLYYGPEPVVSLVNITDWPWPKSWLLDSGLPQERAWGSFWIRAQNLQYLYAASFPQDGDEDRGVPMNSPSVTFVWDRTAQHNLREKFARDSNKTHEWERIRAICNHIRSDHRDARTEYHAISEWTFAVVIVSADESEEHLRPSLPNASFEQDGWKVVTSWGESSQKKDPGTIDIDTLKTILSSDFLIGTFASPWFRVSTALHMAKVSPVSPIRMKRYWSLDIEWLESF